jgi:Fe-S-cluster containining protein
MKIDWERITMGEKFLSAMQILHDCQQCGRCCVHMDGIAFNSADALRMAKQLGIKQTDFLREYTTASARKATDRWLKTKGDEECIFWSKNGCTQYEGRGQVCRLYPFTAPQQLESIRTKKHWGIYANCKGMMLTYKKVLSEAPSMPADTANAIIRSQLGDFCMLRLIADMHSEEAATYAARDIGLEYVPSTERLYRMAWSYAVAYIALQDTKKREKDLQEIIQALEKF